MPFNVLQTIIAPDSCDLREKPLNYTAYTAYIEDLEEKGLRFRVDFESESIFVHLHRCFSTNFLGRELEFGRINNTKYQELNNETLENLSVEIQDVKTALEYYEKIKSNKEHFSLFEDKKGDYLSFEKVDELLKKYDCRKTSEGLLDTYLFMLEIKKSNYSYIPKEKQLEQQDFIKQKENEIDLYKKLIEAKILYKNEFGIYATESSPNIAKWIVGTGFNKNNKRQCSTIEKSSLLETASKVFDVLKEKKSDLTFTKANLKKEISRITDISL